MFGRASDKPQKQIDSLIGEGTSVNGDISFSGGLRIDGKMIGNLLGADDSSTTLVIGQRGSIKGNINVTHLMINGLAEGCVQVEENLELQSNAKIKGDVNYKKLEVQLGAVIDGQIKQGNR